MNQKLELTWIGKEKRPRLEPRILLEDSSRSYHADHRRSESDLFDNRLIFGDNLLALKSLEQQSAHSVTTTMGLSTRSGSASCAIDLRSFAVCFPMMALSGSRSTTTNVTT